MEEDAVADTNLLMEGKGTATTILNLVEYPKAMERELEILWPEPQDYERAIDIMSVLFEAGAPVPAIDVLIASVCIGRGRVLRTKDKHFQEIADRFPVFRLRLE